MTKRRAAWLMILATGLGLAPPSDVEAQGQRRTSGMVPVAVLAGIDQPTIAQRFEEPSRCQQIKQGRKCFYKGGAVEIVFIGGLADWFTVYPQNALYFSSSLTQLGLPADKRPTAETDFVKRRANISGLLEVSASPDGAGKVDYFYVKARTP